jgi:hypothetical protein
MKNCHIKIGRVNGALGVVHTIKVSVVTVGILHIGKFEVLREKFEGTDSVFNTESVASNSSYKIPTVITQTLIQ